MEVSTAYLEAFHQAYTSLKVKTAQLTSVTTVWVCGGERWYPAHVMNLQGLALAGVSILHE